MNLPQYIKQQPHFFKYLPWFSRTQGLTFLQTIYIRPDIFKDLKSKNPKPENLAILIHEQTHRERIDNMGIIQFGVKYLFSGKFRFHEELEASKAGFKILKKYHQKTDLERKSWVLSSWLYFWPVKFEYARKYVYKAWKEI